MLTVLVYLSLSLSAFAKLGMATISFVMSVCQSVRVPVHRHDTTSSHWTDFHEILYLSILRKSVKKMEVSLESDRTAGTVHED